MLRKLFARLAQPAVSAISNTLHYHFTRFILDSIHLGILENRFQAADIRAIASASDRAHVVSLIDRIRTALVTEIQVPDEALIGMIVDEIDKKRQYVN